MATNYFWVKGGLNQPLPSSVLQAGTDSDGAPIYIGRFEHKGSLVIGKVVPNKQRGYYSSGGKEHASFSWEVLCGRSANWRSTKKGIIPPGAFEAGKTSQGETLYVGRAEHKKNMCVGKVHPSHEVLYIAYGGKEHKYTEYDILLN